MPARAQPALACETASFMALELPRTRIVSASPVRDDPRAGPHCVLRGAVNERTGTDGKPYAIGFEMRLPDAWNGGYFDQLNGGNDGSVVPAYGNLPTNQPDNALARGYAVLSSDSGHDGRANADAGLIGGNVFGFDHQARLDYGYTANVTLTPIAKKIIEGYYGRRPARSYMVGCSNGGRHALVGATRLASEFDGFLAGAPGYNLPMVALQHAWDLQSFALASDDVRRTFSRDDMRLVANGVLALRFKGFKSWGRNPDFTYFGGNSELRGYEYLQFIGHQAFFANAELRFPLIEAMLTPLGVLGGLRGVFFANMGAAGFNTQPYQIMANNTEIYPAIAGYDLINPITLELAPRYEPVRVSGLRLVDGRASYGIGLESFILGFPMHFDWSWRTLFNRDWEDALFRTCFQVSPTSIDCRSDGDAFRKMKFSFWIGYDF